MQGFAMLFVTKYRESTEVANTPTLGLTEHDTLAFCGKWIKNPAPHGRWTAAPTTSLKSSDVTSYDMTHNG